MSNAKPPDVDKLSIIIRGWAHAYETALSSTVITIGGTSYAGIPEAKLHGIFKKITKKDKLVTAKWYSKDELEAVISQTDVFNGKDILVMTFTHSAASEKKESEN